MVRPINVKAEEREKAMQKAIASVKNRTYRSIHQAAKELGVSKATLNRRLNGGKSRYEGKENQQRFDTTRRKSIGSMD